MIELDIKNFIDQTFTDPAYMEIPAKAPESFFIIEKVGGSRSEQIDAAVVAIQAYAPTMYHAAEMSENLIDAMLKDFVELPNITSAELNSSYNYPDTRIKKYRYQSLFEIYYYGGKDNE